MSRIIEIFGPDVLGRSKEDVIRLIKSSPLIFPEDRAKYLKDWGAATGTALSAQDYTALLEPL